MNIHSKQTLDIHPENQTSVSIVGTDLMDEVTKITELTDLNPTGFLILSDETVFKLYGSRLIRSLQGSKKPIIPVVIPSGEKTKTITTVQKATEVFFQSRFNRKSILIAMGGGVITDLGGFIASIILRGIRCVYIPTTLLAMVDASIGGKTGVDVITDNNKMYKNMLGTIVQPALVISDINTLHTLPDSELRNGLGEMVKYWAGWGRPVISAATVKELKSDGTALAEIITVCQKLKMHLVSLDPYDTKGMREHLNLGHTFAHAIESASHTQISHGEAVAIGIIAAAKVSELLHICKKGLAEGIESIVSSLGLNTRLLGISVVDLISAMRMDKKGGVFVLLSEIGKLKTGVSVPENIIQSVMKEMTV